MKALDGLLVIAVEQAVAAPLCSARLAQAGARVIKVERPGGDFARGYDQAARGESSYFTWINQGKESVVLDFKNAGDKQLLLNMIARADVFIQNLAPGALARVGLDPASLCKTYPRLICCDISGYGDNPQVANLKAYDLLVQAESGLISVSGSGKAPGRIGVSMCDIGAGVTAHAAIVEALYRRFLTGQGANLKVSLFDVAAEWMNVPFIHEVHGSGAPGRQGLRHPSIAPYGAYCSGDGIDTIISIQNEREWQRFCELVLENGGLAADPRFVSNNARVENRDALDEIILAVTGAMTADQFRARLGKASVAYGAINSVADLARHPALRRQRALTSGGAEVDIIAPPVQWAGEPLDPSMAVPAIGEHSAAIREEFGTR